MAIIQGWVPRRIPDSIVNLLGRLAGSSSLAAGMSKRRLTFLNADHIHSCALADFYSQGLFLLNRLGVLSRGKAARYGWRYFGRSSAKYLKDADIFHVRSGAGRGGAIAKAKNSGMKVVVDHSIAHPAFLERALKEEYANFGLSFWMGPEDPFWRSVLDDCQDADALLVNSDFVKDTFVDNGYPRDRIHVVYLGVREDFFGLKKQYAVKGRIELLFTGGFGIRKGAQYLLPAIEKLVRDGMDLRLTIVGTVAEAQDLLDNSLLAERLNCVGYLPQDNLKDHLTNADIYVFPSLAEGCASSGLEAMAAGLPVITTRESGLPITHGEHGWIVTSKSVEELANAIQKLAEDRLLRERLGRAASITISNGFTWQNYARRVHDLYIQLSEI